jgi:hypothetical protein
MLTELAASGHLAYDADFLFHLSDGGPDFFLPGSKLAACGHACQIEVTF